MIHGFIGTKMIGLLIFTIAILLIILIVVAARSSETRVEPFAPYSHDNYVNGLYTNKIIIDSLSNDIKINEVGLIDFFLPDGIIVIVKTKDALPGGIQWKQLTASYYLSDHNRCEYKTNIQGTETVNTYSEDAGKIYGETTLDQTYSIKQAIKYVRGSTHEKVKHGNYKFRLFNRDGVIERPEPSSLDMLCFVKEKTTGACNDVCPKDMIMLSVNTTWVGKTTYGCKKCLLKTANNASLKYNEVKGSIWNISTPIREDITNIEQIDRGDYVAMSLQHTGDNFPLHVTSYTKPKPLDITTYPVTYNVNIFVNNTSKKSSQKKHDKMDPIDNNYSNGIFANTGTTIHVSDVKNIIDTVYPVGTILLFMHDIDLAKYWAGTKWKEINYAYLGHDPGTNPGQTFGTDTVELIGGQKGMKISTSIVKFGKNKSFLFAIGSLFGAKSTASDRYLELENPLILSNHLPRYAVRIYQRTE